MAGLTPRAALASLGDWAQDGVPFQLHPGDIGWHWRFGEAETQARLVSWAAGAAIGLSDGPTLLRLAIDPRRFQDAALAREVVDAVVRGAWSTVEAPEGSAVRSLLLDTGWEEGDAWLPMVRDLSAPVTLRELRVVPTDAETVGERVAVQRAAFANSTFSSERWATMASGPAYATARCLVLYGDTGEPVATATVWSAGEGRPGLVEPLGVHRDHRGRGFGTAIALAAAGALRDLGASSALVAAEVANAAAVATYASAGYRSMGETRDLRRP